MNCDVIAVIFFNNSHVLIKAKPNENRFWVILGFLQPKLTLVGRQIYLAIHHEERSIQKKNKKNTLNKHAKDTF